MKSTNLTTDLTFFVTRAGIQLDSETASGGGYIDSPSASADTAHICLEALEHILPSTGIPKPIQMSIMDPNRDIKGHFHCLLLRVPMQAPP
ncbi:hypothetical protein V8E36_008514 [Tilletia maclaganii]